jgi:hypothetical protein
VCYTTRIKDTTKFRFFLFKYCMCQKVHPKGMPFAVLVKKNTAPYFCSLQAFATSHTFRTFCVVHSLRNPNGKNVWENVVFSLYLFIIVKYSQKLFIHFLYMPLAIFGNFVIFIIPIFKELSGVSGAVLILFQCSHPYLVFVTISYMQPKNNLKCLPFGARYKIVCLSIKVIGPKVEETHLITL